MGKGKKKLDPSNYSTTKLPSKNAEFLEKNPHLFQAPPPRAPIPPPLSRKKVEKAEKTVADKVEKIKVVEPIAPPQPADINAPVICLAKDLEDKLLSAVRSWPFLCKGLLGGETQLDLETVYETLLASGFEPTDVEAAMTICGGDIRDNLDWLSLYISAERRPRGWTELTDSVVAPREKARPSTEPIVRPKPVQLKKRDIVMLDYGLPTAEEEEEEETPRVQKPVTTVVVPTSEGDSLVETGLLGDMFTGGEEHVQQSALSTASVPTEESRGDVDEPKAASASEALLTALGDDAAFFQAKAATNDNEGPRSSPYHDGLIQDEQISLQDALSSALGEDDLALMMRNNKISQEVSETTTATNKSLLDEVDEDAMGSLFDEDTTPSAPLVVKGIPRFTGGIPKHWSGQTPKALLSSHALKRNFDEPRYPKTGKGTLFRVVLSCGTSVIHEFEKEAICASESVGRELVAAWALFNVFAKDYPALDIQLPPDFRALWREWIGDEAQKADEAALAKVKPRVDFVARLMAQKLQRTGIFGKNAETPAQDVVEAKRKHGGEGPSGRGFAWKIQDLRDVLTSSKRIDTSQLPIYNIKEQLIDYFLAEGEDFAIVCGETGSGKTTQVPRLMLETMVLTRGSIPRIAIAEPRRASATSVSKRVGEELACGELAGYQIRGESTVKAERTCLMFCTTGILLRRAQDDPLFMDLDAVIIDEIHERTMDADVLLVLVKSAAEKRRNAGLRPLKVIAMSATLDSEKFSVYFNGCRVMKSTGRTFPVTVHFLEDVIELTKYDHVKDFDEDVDLFEEEDGTGSSLRGAKALDLHPDKNYSKQTVRSMELLDETVINHALIEKTVLWALEHNTSSHGAVLVFLPGLKDIQQLEGRLGALKALENDLIFTLHSSQSTGDQMRKVFETPKPPQRKIVLSTNIAETGVTIPDVTVVIDTCRANIVGFNERRGLVTLTERFISKNSAEQRMGRAGRVQEGICLRLVSRSTYSRKFEVAIAPEIRRVPLDQVCLSILAQRLDPQEDFFPFTLDPPTPDAVKKALARLERLGATKVVKSAQSSLTAAGISSQKQAISLTPLGAVLARMPVDPRIGKMIAVGSVLGLSDTACALAACMATEKSLFLAPERKRAMANTDSDDLAELRAFREWRVASKPAQYARLQGLHYTRLIDTRVVYEQLKESVRTELGVSPERDTTQAGTHDVRLLKTLVAVGCDWAVFAPTKNRSDYKEHQVVYKCKDGSEVTLAQRSVLYGSNRGALSLGVDGPRRARVFAFSGRVRTKKDNITDMTMVAPITCALLAGGKLLPEHRSRRLDADGGWITLRASPQICALVSRARLAFDDAVGVLLRSRDNSSTEDETKAREVLAIIMQMLVGDD